MIEILRKIAPSESEKEKFNKTAGKLLAEVEREVKKIDSRISAALLGSASRNTWLRYEKDMDVFVLFPLKYEKAQLEKVVTKIGRKILKKPEKRYAEHPYVKGFYRDFEVEIVPCYAVKSPSQLKSAVDRTPFHDAFVKERIKGKENEVRLLKQFLSGISCYGAEAKVEGFSGYLCELLIAKHESFENVLKAAQNWRRREIIQFGNVSDEKLREKFPSPLIFIDPVDANRNVASALSEQKFSKFIFAAKEYLKKPRREFFFPRKRAVDRKTLLRKFKQRGSGLLALIFKKPDVVDDVLYTQLRKALSALKGVLEGRDFCVVGIDYSVSKEICIFIELESIEIPAARLHLGPEVNTLHERKFLEKYESYIGKLTEPFIIGSRWAIFLKRKHSNAKEFLQEFLSQRNLEERGIPSHIARSLEKNFSIKVNEGAFLKEFLPALQEYFDPRFAWER